MPDEVVGTEPEQVQGSQGIQGTQPDQPGTPSIEQESVDLAPDATALQADIERLRKVKEDKEKEAKAAEEKALYWRKQKAEERASYFKERQHPPQEAQQESILPPVSAPVEPRLEQFDDYNKYLEAHSKYLDAKIAHEVKKAKSQWDEDIARKQADSERQQKELSMRQKIDQGYSKYTDFEEIVFDPTLPITQAVHEALLDFDHPEEMVYWLGKNRTEAAKLSRMTPIQVAKYLAKIEENVMKNQDHTNTGNTLTKPRVSNAPPPINPIGSTGGSGSTNKPFDKMTQKEFEAEMERRTGRRY